jgi:hypothetical protein
MLNIYQILKKEFIILNKILTKSMNISFGWLTLYRSILHGPVDLMRQHDQMEPSKLCTYLDNLTKDLFRHHLGKS